jgi:hypothetical protein
VRAPSTCPLSPFARTSTRSSGLRGPHEIAAPLLDDLDDAMRPALRDRSAPLQRPPSPQETQPNGGAVASRRNGTRASDSPAPRTRCAVPRQGARPGHELRHLGLGEPALVVVHRSRHGRRGRGKPIADPPKSEAPSATIAASPAKVQAAQGGLAARGRRTSVFNPGLRGLSPCRPARCSNAARSSRWRFR